MLQRYRGMLIVCTNELVSNRSTIAQKLGYSALVETPNRMTRGQSRFNAQQVKIFESIVSLPRLNITIVPR